MPKYAAVNLEGNERVEYATMADHCAARCSKFFINPGDMVVKSSIDTFHVSCAQDWCDDRGVSHTFRAQHLGLDLYETL